VDLDIMLVHEAGLEQACGLLYGLGYTQSNLNAHRGKFSRRIFLIAKREVHFFNEQNKSHIDLHARAGANTYLTAGLFRNIFNELENHDLEGQSVMIFRAEQYLVYLCYHGALHQFSRLGWLMDIRGFIAAWRERLDYQKVIYLALDIKAGTCLFLTFTLLQLYFGDTVPEAIQRVMPWNWRYRFLVNSCKNMLSAGNGYSVGLIRRARRLLYMMVLINNMPGRLDVLYGMMMRQLAYIIRDRAH
jgi:hypothetical protein